MPAEPNPFDLYIGLVLARLYEARPKRLDLVPSTFGLPEESNSEEVNEVWEGWSNTVQWLQREGYIRCEDFTYGNAMEPWFISVELSEKGFRALNSVPSRLSAKGDQRKFGSQLVELGKKTAWKGASKLGEKGAEEASRRITELVQAWMS